MLHLQIAWLLIFFIGQISLANADQISIGINNKNNSFPHATFTNHTQVNQFTQINQYFLPSSNPAVTPEGLINDLEKRNDRKSSEISKLIEKGDFDKVQKKLDQELRGFSSAAHTLAFYNYIQGGLYLIQMKYLFAERSLNAAVALAPSNCKYRGLFATTLIGLDRYDEASRFVRENVSEVKECLNNGDILDRSRILLAQTHVAMENRNETATVNLIYAFESSIGPLSASKTGRVKLNDGAILACTMESLIQSVWKYDLSQQTRFRSSGFCNKLSENSNKKGIPIRTLFSTGIINESLSRLGSFDIYDLPHRDPVASIKKISDQLELVESSPNIEELGFDEARRSIVLGRLFLMRGLLQLHSSNLAAVASDFNSALAKVEPFASLKNPEALSIYANIVLLARLPEIFNVLEIDFFPLVLDSPEKNLNRLIEEVANTKDYDETPQACRAILMSSLAANFESYFTLLNLTNINKKTENPNPNLRLPSKELKLEKASLSNEDDKYITSKLNSCMNTGLSRNSLLYEEFMVGMQLAESLKSMLNITLPLHDKNLSEIDKQTMQAMEEVHTKLIVVHDRLIGFPKYYENRPVLRRALSQRASWRERQGNYDGARSDLERNVDLSIHFGTKMDAMVALSSLSSLVMRHFNEPTVTASKAQEAFINGIQFISGKDPHSCWMVGLVSTVGNKAARRWLNVGRWDKAVTAMRQIVEIRELQIPHCRSRGVTGSSDGERFTYIAQDAKQALEIMGENSGDHLGASLPIDPQLIKKYSEGYATGDFKQADKRAASLGADGDAFYPLILELKMISNMQADKRIKY